MKTLMPTALPQTRWPSRVVVLLLIAAAISALMAVLDTREIDGASVWAKPLKFHLAFALHLATVLWLLGALDAQARHSAGVRHALHAMTVAIVLEVGWISLQAARGRPSHFNTQTWWEALGYYGLMGGAAVVVVAASAWLGWQIWRRPSAHAGPGWVVGSALGLMLGSALTMIVAGLLATGAVDGPGPWVRAVRSHDAGLPWLGWSTTGGDLRVPHFVATHLVQALPLAGWLLDRLASRQPRTWLMMLGLAGTGLTALTLVQAIAGEPLVGAQPIHALRGLS